MKKRYFPIFLFCLFTLQLGEYSIDRYIFPAFSVGLILLFLCRYISYKVVLVIILSGLYLIVCGFVWQSQDEVFFSYFKVTLFLVSFLAGVVLCQYMNNKEMQSSIIISSALVIIVGLIDLAYKTIKNGFSLDFSNIYLYKESLFFSDTNSLAIYILPVFILSFLYLDKGWLKFFICISIFALLVATLSRTLYLALFVFFLYRYFDRFPVAIKWVIRFSTVLVFVFYIDAMIGVISSDGSGSTKVDIFLAMYQKFPELNSYQQLFGFGLKEGAYIYTFREGHYAHATIALLLGQVGLLGLVMYYLIWVVISLKNKDVFVFSVPVVIMSFSFFPAFNETYAFYLGFISCIGCIEKRVHIDKGYPYEGYVDFRS